jgi:hypothetical protein
LAASTQNILFVEMLKYSKNIIIIIFSLEEHNFVQEAKEYFENFSFKKMKISKLINYSTDMC